MVLMSAMLAFGLTSEAVVIPVGAVTKSKSSQSSNKKTEETEESESDSKSSKSKTDSSKDSKTEEAELTETDSKKKTDSKDAEAEDTDAAGEEASDSTSKTTKTEKTATKSSGKSSSASSKTDSKGDKILMTESQRRSKFKSKSNPKRGTKPSIATVKPDSNGFKYADFGTCNNYNSENGLGGSPMYLLGTVTDMAKVTEGDTYYGVAILVNDYDGYQWYMRADISKEKYDLFKTQVVGKTGYIYGVYSGYSGVTNRPMLDMTLMVVNGGAVVNALLYR